MAAIIEMPKLGFDMAEGTLVNWVKAEGEKISKGEPLAEIETDKATIQVESNTSGILYKQLVEANTTVPVGSPIAVIADEGESINLEELLEKRTPVEEESVEAQPAKAQETPVPASKEPTEPEMIKASPLAKSIAKAKGIDLTAIHGSGPDGRIVKRDVENASQPTSRVEKPVEATRHKIEVVPGKDQNIPLSRLRAAIGRRMQSSFQNVPHFFVTHSYDVGGLLKMRKQMNEGLPEDQKLSLNDFILRAAALTLRTYPNLNASFSEAAIIQHGNINTGLAVSIEDGLLTVVIKNADQKSLSTISLEAREMIQRARLNKLHNEDVEGSTFTISNLGMFDVENFAAIINPPEAAILAVASAQATATIENGQVTAGWRMKATLSVDHRVTDGAEAAQFMHDLAVYLEQPWRLI
jgi:pyruvate dehydrogenase E2 component (dihydrolipoamide acetyltransferase)